MKSLMMYCLSLNNEDFEKIKTLGYEPVGLGDKYFSDNWIRDNEGENISYKNKYYGEYTFHYWFWKNKIKEIDDKTWIGFCAYRRFWSQKINKIEISNKEDFLSTIPNEWKNYETILGQQIYMDGWTPMKIIKHGLKSFILNPKYFLKKNRNLKLHFDSFHGYGKIEKAIELLPDQDREDFKKFLETNISYNRGNMFICKSKEVIIKYYESVFPWLEKSEKIFGFKDDSYGITRIYAFLAERYLSYWFNKYSKSREWPVVFFDINTKNNFN
tara:strand:+ start:2359 stop:3171 length:813 start_codon:yes stop_codon:yes gene_type:complete